MWGRGSYLRLDQIVALGADMFEKGQGVDCAFILDLLQHAVNDYVCACAANTSAGGQRRGKSVKKKKTSKKTQDFI